MLGSEAVLRAAQAALETRGWRVTAVDFSATALAYGQSRATILGADSAERVTWVEGDLAVWAPEAGVYDLVTSLYVHVSGSVEEMVARLASGVAPGGTMLLVGHLPIDPLSIAEERPRAVAGSGFDAVICARQRD